LNYFGRILLTQVTAGNFFIALDALRLRLFLFKAKLLSSVRDFRDCAKFLWERNRPSWNLVRVAWFFMFMVSGKILKASLLSSREGYVISPSDEFGLAIFMELR